MPDVTVKSIDDFESAAGGMMKRARSGLGVSSFGMQVLEFPPNAPDMYPNHHHASGAGEGGQEEVYLLLEGSATLTCDDEAYELERGVIARVGPEQFRKLTAGGDGARVVALGGVPGEAFEPSEWTEEGGPEPAPNPINMAPLA